MILYFILQIHIGNTRVIKSFMGKDYHKPGYWKNWYWHKGGREKVNLSKKVSQVLNKYYQEKNDSKGTD